MNAMDAVANTLMVVLASSQNIHNTTIPVILGLRRSGAFISKINTTVQSYLGTRRKQMTATY
jgi:hypothetical protein